MKIFFILQIVFFFKSKIPVVTSVLTVSRAESVVLGSFYLDLIYCLFLSPRGTWNCVQHLGVIGQK